MIHKRHRIGYYSSFMNSLISSILVTIVIIIVVFCTYYDIFTNTFKMQDNDMFTIGLKIAVAISIIFIIATTIPTIIHIRKEKPSLPPITEQEHEDREYLKSMYYYILKEKGFDHIKYESLYKGFNYLGILDFYMNHGCYEHEQVKKWKYDIHNEILTVKQLFREMSEINQRNDITLYQNVCEKAAKEIRKLNKQTIRRNQEINPNSQLRLNFQEYLD